MSTTETSGQKNVQNYRFRITKTPSNSIVTLKEDIIRLHSEIRTGHLLRHFDLHLTKYHGLTWGYDGLVIARDYNFETIAAIALPSHRYQGGVKKAYVHPLGTLVLSLGRENVIACTVVANARIDSQRNYVVTEQTKIAVMFKRPTIGFVPEGKPYDFDVRCCILNSVKFYFSFVFNMFQILFCFVRLFL